MKGKRMERELSNSINEYHTYMVRKKNEITTKINTIMEDKEVPTVYRTWLSQVLRFIEEDCDVKL